MDKKMNQRKITIEYYNTCQLNREYGNNFSRDTIDISVLLDSLSKKEVKDRCINYNGENLLLSFIEFNKNSRLWELIFFKSRSSTIPIIIDTNGNSRQILLKENEMISEALCILYDPSKQILCMQRNIYAVGTKGIEEFFSSFLKNNIYLESIHNLDSKKKSILKGSKLKKFKLRIRNEKNKNLLPVKFKQYNKNTSICNVIDSALAVNSSIINVEFSMGKSSNVIKIEDDDFEVFQDLMNNNNVKNLELGFVPDERANMQITDFMDSRIHDTLSIVYAKGEIIDFKDIINKMTEKYKNNLFFN